MKRFIFGSSGTVQRAAEKYEPIKSMVEARLDDIPDPRSVVSHLDPPWPDAMYGVDKTAGEAMARLFSETHGSAIVVRIGRVRAKNRQRIRERYQSTSATVTSSRCSKSATMRQAT